MKSPFSKKRSAEPHTPSPFQELHIDVLSEIFILSLPFPDHPKDIGPPSRSSAPLSVLHVCRSWRESALATPLLWSQIHFSDSYPQEKQEVLLDYWKFALDRSRSTLLDVCLNLEPLKDGLLPSSYTKPDSDLRALIERTLVAERYRWRLVHLCLPADFLPLQMFKGDEFARTAIIEAPSRLEHLSLCLSGRAPLTDYTIATEKEEVIALDISQCERLSGLTWGSSHLGVMFDETKQYSKLTSVHIQDGTLCPPEQFAAFLSAAPNLETLCAFFPYETNPDSYWDNINTMQAPTPTPEQMLYVPHLQCLDISENPKNSFATEYDAAAFLNRLVLPSLSSLTFRTVSHYSDAVTMFGLALRGLIQRSAPPLKKLVLFSRVPDEMLIETLRLVPSLEHVEFSKSAALSDVIVREMTATTTTALNSDLDPGRGGDRNGSTPLCPELKTFVAYARCVEDVDVWSQLITSRAIMGTQDDASNTDADGINFQTLERVELRGVYDYMRKAVKSLKRSLKGRGLSFVYS